MTKYLSTTLTLLFITNAFAEYKTAACNEAKGETCIVKEFGNNQEFYAKDIPMLRDYISKNPNLPWVDLIDSKHTLVNDLTSAKSSLVVSERENFNVAMQKYNKSKKVDDLLSALESFLKSNPAQSFSLSNSDSNLAQKFSSAMNGKESYNNTASSNTNGEIKPCKPNAKKYQEIMDQMVRCGQIDNKDNGNPANQISFYRVLAEIAACDKFEIDQIGVIQDYLNKDLTKPCVINLKGSSASIGGGHIEIKTRGQIKTIKWDAGYDLSGTKHDEVFWRAHLLPKINAAFSDNSNGGTGSQSSDNVGGSN